MARACEQEGRVGGLDGRSHGLLLSVLGLTDGVPWQHHFLDHHVHGVLRGEVVFLKEEKEGQRRTKRDGNEFSGRKVFLGQDG